MTLVGHLESLWRYPVKSMRGEALRDAFVSYSGIYGDRIFALKSSASPAGFPYHTGRDQEEMVLYQPRFRDVVAAAKPVNLAEAEAIAPGITPLFADPHELGVDVVTPQGDIFPIGDPGLIAHMKSKLGSDAEIEVIFSERALTDCRPVSLFSVQTARQLADEIGAAVDKRQFRANFYADLASGRGFDEEQFVGKQLRIGDKAVIAILERDPRCKIITLDPETGDANPKLLRHLAAKHEGKAGLYAAVLVEGIVREGDPITVLN